MVTLSACGSSSSTTASDNPPSVAGVYTCDSGCSGTCTFDNSLTVLQNGSNVILRSDSYPDSTGTIDNNGNFTTSSSSCDCSGTIISGTAVAQCTCQGTTCQSVTFID